MIDKFMRKCKERTEQECRNEPTKNIPCECLVVSEKIGKNRLIEITELLRLEHLSFQEKTSVMKLITDSQDRFHIPGEKLSATNIFCNTQISTTDDRSINTRQYRFP